MYFPVSFPKSEYTQEQARERYDTLFHDGNFRVLLSVGLTLTPTATIRLGQDSDNWIVAADQGEKYDMTPEARDLFNMFLEQIQEDFNNKPIEERKEY